MIIQIYSFMANSDNKNPWEDQGDDTSKDKKNQNNESIDEMIRKGHEKLIGFIGMHHQKKGKKGGGSGGKGFFESKPPSLPTKKLFLILAIIILGAWFSTGFYTVQPDEQGVIIRFGKYHRISSPGLNYKLPVPFEKAIVISVTRVNREEIGFRSATRDVARRGKAAQTFPEESQMLTGDENIIDIDFDVQWIIKDARQYLFNVRDLFKENTVKNAAESTIREVIGQVGITDALAEERNNIEFRAKSLLQEMLDSYGMGIQILRLQMLRVEPPPAVIDAYRDVQSAKADRESEINIAYRYRNGVVPNARGDAEAILQEAESYKKQRIAIAEGEAGRFDKIYNQYVKAEGVTRTRMYLEALEEILGGVNKIIIDSNTSKSGILPYLPLEQLRSGGGSSSASSSNAGN